MGNATASWVGVEEIVTLVGGIGGTTVPGYRQPLRVSIITNNKMNALNCPGKRNNDTSTGSL
jgi:hypothetical protein